jgi:peptidoglycan-associated lipoprotein
MQMRESVLWFALAASLVGCHKAPARRASAPPVAPTPPPPAPTPSPQAALQPEQAEQAEYERLKSMDVDAINRMGLLPDIHFDFDRAEIRDGDERILAVIAQALRSFDFLAVTVEGHCDERGTVEYNLALGGRRAAAAHEYLVSLGVPAGRLKTASYGKEAPLCHQHHEVCWGQNRRAHFSVTGKEASP